MFKLSITFTTLAALTAFVTKMGDDVIDGTVTHDQPLADGGTPATPAAKPASSRSRGGKAKTTEAAPAAPNVPASTAPAAPFPGGFTPGGAAQAPAQSVPQSPAAAPASAPVVAPVAQAPVAAPAPAAPVAQPVQVSPERQALNNNFAQLLQYLEQGGTARGYTPEQLGQVISGSLAQAQIAPGTKITEMNDAQANALYPILYNNVLAAVPQQA